MESRADLVKIFPCSALSGAKYLKALKGPLPQIKMMPTGGVSAATAADYLAAGAFAARRRLRARRHHGPEGRS